MKFHQTEIRSSNIQSFDSSRKHNRDSVILRDSMRDNVLLQRTPCSTDTR